MITKGQLSLREVRGLLRDFDSDHVTKDISLEDQIKDRSSTDSIQKRENVLNKSVIVLRIAANRLSTIIESIEDDWLFKEILMHHKNAISTQIDLLIKEKKN